MKRKKENHHEKTIKTTVVIIYQWMLKLRKSSKIKQSTWIPLKYLPKIFIIYEVRNSNFIVEKPGTYHLEQRTKVNINSNKTYWHQGCQLDMIHRQGHITFALFFPEMHYLTLIMRKHQIFPNWGSFYKIPDKYSSKVSKS